MSTAPISHVLKNVAAAHVICDPFPHIVVENAISDSLARELIAAYPLVETITKGKPLLSNKRFSFCARDILANQTINPIWRALVETHISQEFLSDVLRIFRPHILTAYPDFENRFGPLDSLVASLRKSDGATSDNRLLVDAQICINTPVVGTPNSVKSAHVDAPEELFAGLLYLRHPDDDSTGGELEIFKYKNGRYFFQDHNWIDGKYVEKVKTIPYKRGNLIFFLNSPRSLHGVSIRGKTNHPRRFMNLVVETPIPLFDLSHLREGRSRRFWRRLRS